MFTILSAIIPIFLLIGLGALIKIIQKSRSSSLQKFFSKIKHQDDAWSSSLNMFALYVALPAVIVNSLANTNLTDIIGQDIILINVIVLSATLLLAWAYTKIFHVDKALANTYIMCLVFGNVAYIGFPFITSVIPNSASDISILVGIHIAIVFSLGIFILELSKNRKVHYNAILRKIVTNPILIAVFVGFLIMLTGLKLPAFLTTTLQMLASSATPIILIAIGLFIARRIKWDKTLMHAIIISSFKLIALPVVLFLIAKSNQLTGPMSVSIFQAGMPVALTNFALAELYPMDKKLVAKSIIISTVFSSITLSILAVAII